MVYKDVKDFYDQTVFLYKTGKLSYKYWSIWDEYDRFVIGVSGLGGPVLPLMRMHCHSTKFITNLYAQVANTSDHVKNNQKH